MGNKINFTKEELLALPRPERGERAVYLDSKTTGLQVRVTDTGAKTFSVFRRTKGGRPERITLGRFPEMTVEQARRQAANINTEIVNGGKPAQVKRAHKETPTFSEVLDIYIAQKRKKNGAYLSERTKAEYRQQAKLHLKQLSPLKLPEINPESIERLHRKIGKTTPYAANRVRALVSGVFKFALDRKMYSGGNPASGIQDFPETPRDRFLQSDELPRFFKALAEEPNETLRDYILMALLTGARRSNLLAMRWRDVNLAEGVWRIPRTKNGTPQNVTLSPEALTILKARKQTADDEAVYVFPGVGESGHIEEPKKAVIRVMERAEIPYGRKVENGVTLHDLRRTLGSWQAKTGASLAIIGKSLNHQSQQTTAIYARLDLDPVRAAVNTATSAMMEAAGLKKPAEVKKLPKRKSAA